MLKKLITTVLICIFAACAVSMTVFANSGQCGANINWEYKSNGDLTLTGNGKMWDLPVGFREVVDADGDNYFVIFHTYESEFININFLDGTTQIVELSDDYLYSNVAFPNGKMGVLIFPLNESDFETEVRYEFVELPNGEFTTISSGWFPGIGEIIYEIIPLGNDDFESGQYAIIQSSPYGYTIMQKQNGDYEAVKTAPWHSFDIDEVFINGDITQIDESLLVYGGKIYSFYASEDNTAYSTDETGVLYNKDKTKLIRFPGNSDIFDFTIPDTVNEIDIRAFDGCTKLTIVTIPRTVVHFGKNIFEEGTTIKGYNGTYAEKYAEENGYEFQSLGEVESDDLVFDIDDDKTITAMDVITGINNFVKGNVADSSDLNLTKINSILSFIRNLIGK